jgi:hypothetical protein
MRFNIRHILPLALMTFGCGVETSSPVPSETAVGAERVQEQSMLQATSCTSCLTSTGGVIQGVLAREQLKNDVYHYTLRVQVGPDTQHDVVVLHRVVRERSAWMPVNSSESVFMVHGDAWDFRGAFLASTLTQTVPVDHSIAVYLAQQGVDVWGIDLRWTQVPANTADTRFMKNWNLGTHAQDVGTGLAVARTLRGLTGSGMGPMNLLGWSRGAAVAYAYMNAESQLPAPQRQVNGFIPVDMVFKFAPEATQQREWACARAQVGELLLSQGQYEGSLSGPGAGVTILSVGQAAVAAPNVIASAPLPPLTYSQLGLTVGAATFSLLTDAAHNINPSVPFYHFAAGQFGQDGLPTGLQYQQSRQFFDFLSSAHPYQSFTEMVETDQLLCGQKNLPYDDHLKDVKVPVLYVGAAGGFGSFGAYVPRNLLGSKDVTVHMVQRLPDAARVADYGHADLFLASDAKTAVWDPIFQWMKRH